MTYQQEVSDDQIIARDLPREPRRNLQLANYLSPRFERVPHGATTLLDEEEQHFGTDFP